MSTLAWVANSGVVCWVLVGVLGLGVMVLGAMLLAILYLGEP